MGEELCNIHKSIGPLMFVWAIALVYEATCCVNNGVSPNDNSSLLSIALLLVSTLQYVS